MIAGELDGGRPRIFGIGLNKTGTTTMHRAVTVLGFTSLHWGGPPIRRLVEAAIGDDRPLLDDLDPAVDAFFDIEALSLHFERLDLQYPGSRFILTVRPVDEWINSRRRHVEHNVIRKERGEYDGTFLVVDEEHWREKWKRHVDAVRAYFSDRADFLEIDVTRCAQWEPLCIFLGVDVPTVDFPWANRGSR